MKDVIAIFVSGSQITIRTSELRLCLNFAIKRSIYNICASPSPCQSRTNDEHDDINGAQRPALPETGRNASLQRQRATKSVVMDLKQNKLRPNQFPPWSHVSLTMLCPTGCLRGPRERAVCERAAWAQERPLPPFWASVFGPLLCVARDMDSSSSYSVEGGGNHKSTERSAHRPQSRVAVALHSKVGG